MFRLDLSSYSGELNEAITYYEEALVFAEDQLQLNHLINAQTYSLLDDCYLEKKNLNELKNCTKKAFKIESL
jgi:tetratricopeptide (TPR) repeat protein